MSSKEWRGGRHGARPSGGRVACPRRAWATAAGRYALTGLCISGAMIGWRSSGLHNRMFSILIPSWNDSAYLQRAVAAHQAAVHVDDGADGTMAEPRDSRNRCVVVRGFVASVETLRKADLLAADLPAAFLNATAPRRPVGPVPGVSSDNDFSMEFRHAGWRHMAGAGSALVYPLQCKSTGRGVRNNRLPLGWARRGNGPPHNFGG